MTPDPGSLIPVTREPQPLTFDFINIITSSTLQPRLANKPVRVHIQVDHQHSFAHQLHQERRKCFEQENTSFNDHPFLLITDYSTLLALTQPNPKGIATTLYSALKALPRIPFQSKRSHQPPWLQNARPRPWPMPSTMSPWIPRTS